jgi:hypothetical protein
MRKAWRFILRVVFWSYERGSLPYDLMVIAILLFVLLTPRKWYHDQPNLSPDLVSGQIRLLNVDTASRTEVFRVDAALLAPPPQAPQLEQETHALLSRSISSLRGQHFQVVQIQPVRSGDGAVVGYDVRIKPSAVTLTAH